jgi:hypothetical protein
MSRLLSASTGNSSRKDCHSHLVQNHKRYLEEDIAGAVLMKRFSGKRAFIRGVIGLGAASISSLLLGQGLPTIQAAGSSGVTTNSVNASGEVAFWDGPTDIAGDNSLVWDNAAKELGVGGAPTAKLSSTWLGVTSPAGGPHSLETSYQIANSSSISGQGQLIGNNFNFEDSGTGGRDGGVVAHFYYKRDSSAIGTPSSTDSNVRLDQAVFASLPGPLRALDIVGPDVASGKTLAGFEGIHIGASTGGGMVATNFALITDVGSGNVGIGTTQPTAELHVKSASAILPSMVSQGASGQVSNLQEWNNDAGTALAAVNSSGSLGLGTSLPFYTLDVRTSGTASSQMHITSNGPDGGGYFTSANPWNLFMSAGAAWNGSAWVAKNSTAYQYGGGTAGVRFFFDTGLTVGSTYTPTTRMFIGPTGNVGIGMSTQPAHLLQLGVDDAAKPSTNTWTIASDGRLKDPESIEPFTEGSEFIKRLPQPVWFRYKKGSGLPSDRRVAGWIAQDVAPVAPFMVRKTKQKLSETDPDETDTLSLNTNELPYALVNFAKEVLDKQEKLLQRQEDLEAENRTKSCEIEILSAQVKKLERAESSI